ncbi:MAG: hypothetical protein ACTSRU_15515 [Candidatus Hodarchaeales archaeon]
MIQNTYSPDKGYCVISQVSNSTGFADKGKRRTADAWIFSYWPSRGIWVAGVEIKVARGDWLKELNDPEKAEAIAQFCDYWYVVAPKGVVDVDYVPVNWGYMETVRKKVKVLKKPIKLDPIPLNCDIIASIMKKFYEQIASNDDLKREYDKGYCAGEKDGQKLAKGWDEGDIKSLNREIKDYQEGIDRFEEASGVNIGTSWNAGDIGTAVKSILAGNEAVRIVKYMKRNLERALESVEKVLDAQEGKIEDCQQESDWELLYYCISSFPEVTGVFLFGKSGKVNHVGFGENLKEASEKAIDEGLDYASTEARWIISSSFDIAEKLANTLIEKHNLSD